MNSHTTERETYGLPVQDPQSHLRIWRSKQGKHFREAFLATATTSHPGDFENPKTVFMDFLEQFDQSDGMFAYREFIPT